MNKRQNILKTLAVTFIVFGLVSVVWLGFSRSADVIVRAATSWCHSFNPVANFTEVEPTIFSDKGDAVTFLRDVRLYRPAVGICAFPDGGQVARVSAKIDIYTVELANPNVTYQGSINLSKDAGTDAKPTGWDGQKIYIAQGQADHYVFDLTTKTSKKTSTEFPEKPTESYRFSPSNPQQWISTRDGFLALYHGFISYNTTSQTVNDDIAKPKTIEKILVPTKQMVALTPQDPYLQPSLEGYRTDLYVRAAYATKQPSLCNELSVMAEVKHCQTGLGYMHDLEATADGKTN
jgi:hypothetical protein